MANIFIDIAFLLEQVLKLAALILKVVHFQFQALYLGFIAFLLLPLVVLQNPVKKCERPNKFKNIHSGRKLLLSIDLLWLKNVDLVAFCRPSKADSKSSIS